MNYLYIFIGGGLGSVARYLTSKAGGQLFPSNFPMGTVLTNLLACLLLAGLIVGFNTKSAEYPWLHPLLIMGFCGGFSTFSTFSNETYDLLNNGQITLAILNVVVSVGVGVALIFLIRAKT